MYESEEKPRTKIPRFRWRIIPAFATLGLFCLVVILFFNNVVVGQAPITHRGHFLIFIGGLCWLAASILFVLNKCKLASFVTIIGFALPFFRPI